jgi:hypothetical protein
MPIVMSNDTHTYTGVWIDWSQGAIRGAKLTLIQKRAGILTAFLAVLVSSAGNLFWNIVAFAIHQAYTKEAQDRRDVPHYQRQVIIRNKGTIPAAWALLKLPFDHRRTVSKRFLRSLPFTSFAIFFSAFPDCSPFTYPNLRVTPPSFSAVAEDLRMTPYQNGLVPQISNSFWIHTTRQRMSVNVPRKHKWAQL